MKERSLIRDMAMAPLSWIYGLGVVIRNWMFDAGILSSTKFDIPIISVGNITVGGTGKTPMTEYLIELLQKEFKIAVVSRGYKRKTSGYVLSSPSSTPQEIGDEPYQMKRKFPDLKLAVDGSRVRAIRHLLEDGGEKPELVILDDAYQHRYVVQDYPILLTCYDNLIYEDHLLPLGRMREPLNEKSRAKVVVVTKCPSDITPMELRIITKNLSLYPYQKLYFTTTDYQPIVPVFPQSVKHKVTNYDIKDYSALSVSAIAAPLSFQQYVSSISHSSRSINFSDHKTLTLRDYDKIVAQLNELENSKRVILTTEKDAVKMTNDPNFPEALKGMIYFVPMKIRFIKYDDRDEQTFNHQIISYVTKNRSYMRVS